MKYRSASYTCNTKLTEMKHLLTAIACCLAVTGFAQTFSIFENTLYSTSKKVTQPLGLLLFQESATGIIGVELNAIGTFDTASEVLISDFLIEKFNLSDGAFAVDFSYRDSAQPITILTDKDVFEATLSPKQLEIRNKPPLWRAGHHTINAVSWSVGGSAIATGALLIGQPIAAGVILVISSIGNIVEAVKSGRALKEASETDSVEPNRD